MKLLMLICAAAAMPLAACATSPNVVAPSVVIPADTPTSASSVMDTALVDAARTLTVAAITYDSAAKAATAAVQAGLIHGAALDTLARLNALATTALDVGYAANTAAGKVRAAADLAGIIQQIKNLAAP